MSWLDAIPEKALAKLRKVVTDCVIDLHKSGEQVPEPLSAKSFSGRFVVRVPPQLHRDLAIEAAESGVSLNRLVSHKLSR